MWWIMRLLDRRWASWHAQGVQHGEWLVHRPRLCTFTEIPLSTWLRDREAGWESYLAHLEPRLLELEMRQLMAEPDRGDTDS
jgi:hypothetical protein